MAAEHVNIMRFFLELFVFFNCFSLTLEVTVPDDSDDEFAYEEVRFFLFGYTFWHIKHSSSEYRNTCEIPQLWSTDFCPVDKYN